jgi:DNA-binding MarR family transcriptional regulator
MLASKFMLEVDQKSSRSLIKDAQSHLRTTLHVPASLKAWGSKRGLPLFLANGFEYRQTELFGHAILLVVPKSEDAKNPSGLSKQLGAIQRHFEGILVLVLDHLSAYQRSRLIEESAAFIVPGNQLFIPQLAMDLREHFRRRRDFAEDQLSPASQALFLRYLNLRDVENARPSDLAEILRYSAMSIGRAFEELEASELAHVETRGRSKHIQFSEAPRELFEAAASRLRSPVKAEHWFRAPSLPKGFHGSPLPEYLPTGGESALSERSTMSRPRIIRFAAGPKDWKRIQSGEFGKEVEQDEEPNFAIDVWWYDPDIVSGAREVDVLSLYLQFRDSPDERLEAAAEQLLEEFAW